MSAFNNDEKIPVPTGIQDKWDDFPWEKFPAGVTVHFGLTEAGKLYLLRRGYSYWVCEQQLRQGEVLADVVGRLHKQLASEGVDLQRCHEPKVCAVRQEQATLRVLLGIECVPLASRTKLEPFDLGLVLEGIIADHPMRRELAEMPFHSRRGILAHQSELQAA